MNTVPSKINVLQSAHDQNTSLELLPTEASSLRHGLPETTSTLLTGNSVLTSIRRLIVLVPDLEVDQAELARQIWELASPPGLAVLFFSLCTDISNESHMNRRLIALAAMTREPRVHVETRLEFGRNWIHAIRKIFSPGDIVVCPAEQSLGWRRKPLGQILEAAHVPVWTLSGFYSLTPRTRNWLVELIFWVVSIAIMLGFFWLQTQVVNFSNSWAQNIFLILSVFAEVGLLWGWHAVSS